MENNINQTPENTYQPQTNNYYSEIGFTGKTLFFLNGIGKWSKYYSLFTFALFGIGIVLMLISAASVAMSLPDMGIWAACLLVGFCIILCTGLIPMWFLMRSSNKIKEGLHSEFLPDLLHGIDDLTSFFKTSSIYVTIMLVVMIIGFCLMLIFQGSIATLLQSMKTMG